MALDARDTLPAIKKEFERREKKTYFLEFGDLRLQLLRVLADWLPDNEATPFLMTVAENENESPQVRFRAVILLCERGDVPSLEYLETRYFLEAAKVEPLLTVETLEKSLKDRRLFAADQEFASFKLPGASELAELQEGIQLAQHFFAIQRRGATAPIQSVSPGKVRLRDGKIDRFQFYVNVPSESWQFELRKKGDRWLPCNFYMWAIE